MIDIRPLTVPEGQNLACVGSSCEIAGQYATTTGGTAPLLLHLTGATWTASLSSVPGNAKTGSTENASLFDVSCGFDGGCAAVGHYSDTAGGTRPLVEMVTSGGTATGVEAPQPSDMASGASVSAGLQGVSCVSSTQCTAVGTYVNSVAPNAIGLIDTLSGTTWSAQSAAVPSNAATGASAQSELFAVDCTARSACVSGGDFFDPGNQFGLLDSYTPPEGYWTDASDGGIFSYGAAVFHGSMGDNGSTRRSSAWRTPRGMAATGRWPLTAGSSASATRCSMARRATST